MKSLMKPPMTPSIKPLFKYSAALIVISALISLYIFANPVEETFLPHWALPLISAICLVILIGANRGPTPKNPERGFWAILLGVPILGILFQLSYLGASISWLSVFKNELVPILGLHVFLAIVGNYVTTSRSMLSGLPTPWNLRSDLSWRKSHRLAGYGLVLLALISAAATLAAGEFQEHVLGIGMIILLASFAVYSWWVWRSDPDRRPLLGTS